MQIITEQDIKNSGYTTIAQVLQNISANGQGTLSQGFPQAFAGGASGISIHGLNTSATLVLIDGHRMAPFPLSDDGQRQFVDVSNIPFDAVERIEVLKDGASAVYGSDAMAGVVNIILKRSYVGTTVTAEYGVTTEGGGQTSHTSITHGWGDYDADGYNAYFNVEYRHQDSILYSQRTGDGAWQQLNWSGNGGISKQPGAVTPQNPEPPTSNGTVYLTSPTATTYTAANSIFIGGNCTFARQQANLCTFQNPGMEIEPRTQNVNLLGSFSKKLEGDWKLDVKASLFDSQGEQYTPGGPAGGLFTYPTSFSPNVAVSSGVNPTIVGTTIPTITVPAGYPGNTSGTAQIVNGVIPGAPIPHTEFDSKAVRLVADLQGTAGAWDIDASFGHTSVSTLQTVFGTINIPALNAALNSTNPATRFSITGGNQSLYSTIFPQTSANDNSALDFAEFHAARSIGTLAGGDLQFSTGASFTDRTMHSPAPSLIAEGIVAGNNAYVSGSQQDTAAYAEIVAPVLKSLDLEGSVRYDHFDDAESSWTPSLKFKWSPVDWFALRGTAGTGFRAPNAAENGQSGQAYLYNTINDPVLCPNGTAANGKPSAGCFLPAYNFQPVYLNSSNPNLQPEKSTNETLGMIFEPVRGWSSTLDLWQVEIRNQIVAGSPNIAQAVRGAPITGQCADGNGGSTTCTSTAGPILYIPVEYVNANSTKSSGIELESKYKLNLGSFGTLTPEIQWSHTMSYILKIDGVEYGLAGTHGPFIIGGDTGNPRDRIEATLTYDRGPWEVATTMNYISTYNLTDPSIGVEDCAAGAGINGWYPNTPPPNGYCTVASFTTFDVSLHYTYDKHWVFFGAVDNIFNRQPPVDFNTYGGGQLPYNPSFHLAGAIGRFVDIGATYKF